jgi:hypothetical protein
VNISDKTLNEKFAAEQPDSKMCVHAVKGKAFRLMTGEGTGSVGVVLRLIGHTNGEGEPVSIDVMCDPKSAIELLTVAVDEVPTMAGFDTSGDSVSKIALLLMGP